jgi:peptide methionine sulfoxide reductase MsrA
MSKDPFENISKALDTTFDKAPEKKDIQVIKEIKRSKEEVLEADFNSARTNMKELINNGMDALDGIMKVASASDSPRAYEVAALLLKTLSDMNKDLMTVHEKSENIQKEKVTNITNNSIYVGSTTELQNLINKSRSQNKQIDNA